MARRIVEVLHSVVFAPTFSSLLCYRTLSLWQHVNVTDSKAQANGSQHFNATYRNIVGCNMLRASGHPVLRQDMLGVFGSNLKMIKFFTQHLWMLHNVVVVWPGSLRLGMCISSIFNWQHVATRCNRVAKRVQRVALNNVAICCVRMLLSFGRSLQMLRRTMLGCVALRSCYRVALNARNLYYGPRRRESEEGLRLLRFRARFLFMGTASNCCRTPQTKRVNLKSLVSS